MTDPRIEAALSEYSRAPIEEPIESVMAKVLNAADAAAWIPISSAPNGEKIIIGHDDYAFPGYKYSSLLNQEWIGLFFCAATPGEPLSPQPTHWQPLPKPPAHANKHIRRLLLPRMPR